MLTDNWRVTFITIDRHVCSRMALYSLCGIDRVINCNTKSPKNFLSESIGETLYRCICKY